MSDFLLETELQIFPNYLCEGLLLSCGCISFFQWSLCPVSPVFILFWTTQCKLYFCCIKKKVWLLIESPVVLQCAALHKQPNSWIETVGVLWSCTVACWLLVYFSQLALGQLVCIKILRVNSWGCKAGFNHSPCFERGSPLSGGNRTAISQVICFA